MTIPIRIEDFLRADPSARAEGLRACLARIRRLDPVIRAWTSLGPLPQIADGPLAGIPVGIKDVIDTRDLPTTYGSPIYEGRRGEVDAASVQRLRALGAVILGKTDNAWFAYKTPPRTRNPRNLGHTPGGSSSGSAAAVAADMVPFSVGTQTLGSMLRPASYCGVTGFKPTYGTLPIEGVMPVSPTLDTLGLFTHTPAGMLNLWDALGYGTGVDEPCAFGVVADAKVDPEMAHAFGEAVARLRAAGFVVEPAPIAPLLDALDREGRLVMSCEAAVAHADRYREHGDRLRDLADLVRTGMATPRERYEEARASISDGREQIAGQFRRTPVILVPAAPGAAPKGLGSTGDARLNSAWTALGTPAISIPLPVTGLPLGLQLTAARGEDARLLRAAVRVVAVLSGALRG